MTLLQALWFAALQGATELFPVSSLGHAVLIPSLLKWNLDLAAEFFLPVLVVLHLGTAAALLIYFRHDWVGIVSASIHPSRSPERAASRRLLLMIIIATLPAAATGFLFERPLRNLFGSPSSVALLLVINGFVLFFGERLRRKACLDARLDSLRWRDALIIGLFQCAALAPGISRSGATMVAGLWRGLDHAAAAHFSFLIATPVILGAAVLEVPHLLRLEDPVTGLAVLAGLVAGAIAYLSTWVLMRYFGARDFQSLRPFAYYCWFAGLGAFLLITLR